MRVTGGRYRGRLLKTSPGLQARPTADKTRQAIFNILMKDVENKMVLDLFAGSGSLGIEALSRGAESALFVESGRPQVHVIRENLTMLGLDAEVIERDCRSACRYLAKVGRKFDLIFADPPYREYAPLQIVDLVTHYDLLAPGGFLIIEHKSRQETATEKMAVLKQRRFGQTEVTFYGSKEN
ncbi:MAG: 16S rRNA (guanine(966)-N(2))-methyltransferase RsmD [Candidatus Zixiibacteriota bacterium]|nr:MAG: 16S rRNA (guanine(966)-N(2))-methyltransferase RsmD [candidate division Zixibacteria bacterium]